VAISAFESGKPVLVTHSTKAVANRVDIGVSECFTDTREIHLVIVKYGALLFVWVVGVCLTLPSLMFRRHSKPKRTSWEAGSSGLLVLFESMFDAMLLAFGVEEWMEM